ncbi:MAG: hypothetical protein OK454_05400, partial [Thaumarchaeota archaeon]|nr:hypothetical protein [Nitrososphaerota archaeon]
MIPVEEEVAEGIRFYILTSVHYCGFPRVCVICREEKTKELLQIITDGAQLDVAYGSDDEEGERQQS